jgi:AcrR family transcriptional regulator
MSPRTTAQNEQIRQKSRKKIMQAAFQLIARDGYEATSIAEIARTAGVSKGLLYNYFESKEDLLEKLVMEAMNQGDDLIGELITDDPAETLENIFKWFFNELRTRPAHWKLMTDLTMKIERFQFVHDLATKKMQEYVCFMQGLLEQLGFKDAEGEARMLAALFDGIGIQFIVVRDDYPLDEMEVYLINKYCHHK